MFTADIVKAFIVSYFEFKTNSLGNYIKGVDTVSQAVAAYTPFDENGRCHLYDDVYHNIGKAKPMVATSQISSMIEAILSCERGDTYRKRTNNYAKIFGVKYPVSPANFITGIYYYLRDTGVYNYMHNQTNEWRASKLLRELAIPCNIQGRELLTIAISVWYDMIKTGCYTPKMGDVVKATRSIVNLRYHASITEKSIERSIQRAISGAYVCSSGNNAMLRIFGTDDLQRPKTFVAGVARYMIDNADTANNAHAS